MEIYGCSGCGEIDFAPIEENDGAHICPYCGGKALTWQEAFDKILELKSMVRQLKQDQEWDE